jgi:hypothetical protein
MCENLVVWAFGSSQTDTYLFFRHLKGLQVVADDAELLLKLDDLAANLNRYQ